MEKKQIKHWLKENRFKSVIALGVIAISISTFYYFVILIPQNEAKIAEQAKLDLVEKEKLKAQKSAQEELNGKIKLLEEYKNQEEMKAKQQKSQVDSLQKQVTDLKNRPPESKIINIGGETIDSVSEIVKKWGKRVAYVECIQFYGNYTVTGSATLLGGSRIIAITNKHVITDENGYSLKTCTILVNNEKVYTVTNSAENPKFFGDPDLDKADIELPKDEYLDSLTAMPLNNCVDVAGKAYNVEIGDKIIVLGYPAIGSKNGLTVTDGIVSGIDDTYYITSAKIDRGNSGGAALRVKDGCYLGLPTSSVVGSIESLGRILKARLFVR